MQFARFQPKSARFRFQIRHCANSHAQKMLRFTALFLARPNVFQKLLFRDCVVGFDIIGADTCCRADKLTNDSIRHGILRNRLCEIDNCFAEPRRAFFQIVNTLSSPALRESPVQHHRSRTPSSDCSCEFRISSLVRHSSFELRHSRHSSHAAKKKTPVSTAFMTNIASKDCTTAVVVAWPTPSAPPSTVSPALHEIVMMIQAKTTLLIIPEYKSQVPRFPAPARCSRRC